jgi:hypothetical protein
MDQMLARQLASTDGTPFDTTLSLKFLDFIGPEAREGLAGLLEKRRLSSPRSRV